MSSSGLVMCWKEECPGFACDCILSRIAELEAENARLTRMLNGSIEGHSNLLLVKDALETALGEAEKELVYLENKAVFVGGYFRYELGTTEFCAVGRSLAAIRKARGGE